MSPLGPVTVLACVALSLASVPPVAAAYLVIDDFDALAFGPIDDQGGWMAVGEGSTVAPDPADAANRVLSVVTESTNLHKGTSIPDGSTAMFFFRFRVAEHLSASFGLSGVVGPDRFDHFEVELSVTNAASDLRVNDGGTYASLSPIDVDVWYSCWIEVDNAANDFRIWLHTRGCESATEADAVPVGTQTRFEFRNPTAGELVNVYVKTGGGSGVDGPLYLDDLYLDGSGDLNLTCPDDPTPITGASWTAIKAAFR